MSFKSIALGLACSIGVIAGSAASASTYQATSHYENGSPEHSLWFSGGSNPVGAAGPKGNHFNFELGEDGFGLFETSSTTASLIGTLSNAAGQTFQLMLHLVKFTGTAGYKNPFNKDVSTWDLYDLDTNKDNTLSYLGDFSSDNIDDGDLQSFDISLRGSSGGNPLKGQFGVGANDKDANLLGFSTWITLTDQNSNCSRNCSYDGDINVVLASVPLPATALLLFGALGGLGVASRKRRKASA